MGNDPEEFLHSSGRDAPENIIGAARVILASNTFQMADPKSTRIIPCFSAKYQDTLKILQQKSQNHQRIHPISFNITTSRKIHQTNPKKLVLDQLRNQLRHRLHGQGCTAQVHRPWSNYGVIRIWLYIDCIGNWVYI